VHILGKTGRVIYDDFKKSTSTGKIIKDIQYGGFQKKYAKYLKKINNLKLLE
jgi:hypothetical protein